MLALLGAALLAAVTLFAVPRPATAAAFVVSESQLQQMFPNRNPFSTYGGLTAATASFPAFAGTATAVTPARSRAA